MICMYIHTIWFSSFVCFKDLLALYMFVYVLLLVLYEPMAARSREGACQGVRLLVGVYIAFPGFRKLPLRL